MVECGGRAFGGPVENNVRLVDSQALDDEADKVLNLICEPRVVIVVEVKLPKTEPTSAIRRIWVSLGMYLPMVGKFRKNILREILALSGKSAIDENTTNKRGVSVVSDGFSRV